MSLGPALHQGGGGVGGGVVDHHDLGADGHHLGAEGVEGAGDHPSTVVDGDHDRGDRWWSHAVRPQGLEP